MKKLIPVLILIILISFCRKPSGDSDWERTYGTGKAYFVKATSDSGIIAAGETGGNPYLIRLDKNRTKEIDFSSSEKGLFSSVWSDKTCYITAGSSLGKMLLMRLDRKGELVWNTTISAGFNIDYTTLLYAGNGSLLAVGTASPDSIASGTTSLLFVRFDTAGNIITRAEIPNSGFISANKAVEDNAGNIYLAVTRLSTGSKSKASVAKFNNQFQKIWETELYNNPDFGAASLGIELDGSGNVYVSGKTELTQKEGVFNNSFLVSLTNAGAIRWKKYFEFSNAGSSLIFNDKDLLVMLNLNCFILNIINPVDGSDAGKIRVFDACDSKDSGGQGMDLDQNFDGDIILAGSKDGNFYMALKPSVY